MPWFIVILTYTRPLAAVERVLPAHRAYLDEHFATGTFLVSGPQVPRRGGVIVARAESADRLEAILAADPFRQAGLAAYAVYPFQPTKAHPLLDAAIRA